MGTNQNFHDIAILESLGCTRVSGQWSEVTKNATGVVKEHYHGLRSPLPNKVWSFFLQAKSEK
jgi:hypothetical protein